MGFVAEKDFPGLEAPKIEGKMSLRSSITGQIFLNDIRIPEANVLQKTGFGAAFSCLNKARLGISWGVIGAAEDCFFRAREYMLNRKQFDCALAGFQLPQKKFADMQTEIALA
jgi:glutaryl-CoA dehydrogenase